MNGISGTLCHTFSTKFTLVGINKGQVVFHSDGFIRTDFEAFRAPDTGNAAVLFGDSTFFFVDTADKYFTVFFILFP